MFLKLTAFKLKEKQLATKWYKKKWTQKQSASSCNACNH